MAEIVVGLEKYIPRQFDYLRKIEVAYFMNRYYEELKEKNKINSEILFS